MSDMINQLRAEAEARIKTCDIYLNRNAIVREQWVVVSSLWNRRGAYNADGHIAVGPFHRGMPTLWEKSDAEAVAADANKSLADNGSSETVRLMHHYEWWAREKLDAQDVLATINEGDRA